MATITLDVRIENTYPEHGKFTHERTVTVEAPDPSTIVSGVVDDEALNDWAGDELSPLTGEGLDGHALYEVTVLASPDLSVLKRRTFSWEG